MDNTAFVSLQPIIGLLVLPNGGFAFETIFEEVDHLPEQARYSTKKKSRLWTEKSAKSYDWASEKCARSPEGFALKIQSGMLRNIQE